MNDTLPPLSDSLARLKGLEEQQGVAEHLILMSVCLVRRASAYCRVTQVYQRDRIRVVGLHPSVVRWAIEL